MSPDKAKRQPLPPPSEFNRWAWAMGMLLAAWAMAFGFFSLLFWMAARGFVPPL